AEALSSTTALTGVCDASFQDRETRSAPGALGPRDLAARHARSAGRGGGEPAHGRGGRRSHALRSHSADALSRARRGLARGQIVTVDEIKEHLAEAGRPLRNIRDPRPHVSRLRSIWPDAPDQYWVAYARARPRKVRLPVSGAAIDRMDQCLGWLLYLDVADRRLVSAWMLGLKIKEICAIWDCDRKTFWRRIDRICSVLAIELARRAREAA